MGAEQKIESATLASAMALAFGEFEGATKGKSNPAFKSKYADLESVVEAIKPALVKHGLFFTQHTHDTTGGVCIETMVHHASGDNMSFGKLFVPATKQDAQGFGSALTYARRYSLMAAFGICPEDDDGNAAVRHAPRADPTPVATIRDDQFALIQTLATAVGKSLQDICSAYKVQSIAELTEPQATAVCTRLQSAKPKENA